jgi:peptidoglycan/LPS O-acetylase OafA/YrhL
MRETLGSLIPLVFVSSIIAVLLLAGAGMADSYFSRRSGQGWNRAVHLVLWLNIAVMNAMLVAAAPFPELWLLWLIAVLVMAIAIFILARDRRQKPASRLIVPPERRIRRPTGDESANASERSE